MRTLFIAQKQRILQARQALRRSNKQAWKSSRDHCLARCIPQTAESAVEHGIEVPPNVAKLIKGESR